MADYNKPLPTPGPGHPAVLGQLEGPRDPAPALRRLPKFVYYPRSVCPRCGSDDLTWTAVSGKGTVHAFAIPHRHPNPCFTADGPYVVALVELEEGARIMSNLVDVDPTPEAVKVGMAVEIVYDDVTAEVTLPKFRPS